MIECVEVELSVDPFDNKRSACIGYTFHGDVVLETTYESNKEVGSSKKSLELQPEPAIFIFSHEALASLMAWFSCFAWRCNKPEESLAALQFAKENIEPPHYMAYNHSLGHLVRVAQDQRPMPRFDDLINGWQAVDIPMVTQPGTIEEVGATGIYTGKSIAGSDCLIFHSIPSQTGKTLQETGSHAEFYIHDIRPVMKAITEVALGEYANEVWQLADSVLMANGDSL